MSSGHCIHRDGPVLIDKIMQSLFSEAMLIKKDCDIHDEKCVADDRPGPACYIIISYRNQHDTFILCFVILSYWSYRIDQAHLLCDYMRARLNNQFRKTD